MADKKISQLTSAVLPLAGTELVPVVQSGSTVKVSAASLGAAAAYTPAGTGAVVGTVQAKLRESVSVKDFGAVGDGVTDDTLALVAAAAAMQNGQQLDFAGGTYLISYKGTAYSSVFGNVVMDFLNKSDIALVGRGATIKVVSHNITTYGGLRFANFKGCKRVVIDGLNFDMTFTGVNTSGSFYPYCGAITAIDDDSALPAFSTLNSYFLIKNCSFKLFHQYGNWATTSSPYLGDANNGYKLYSIFVYGPYTPTGFDNQCRNIDIKNCTWLKEHNGYGIWLWAWNNCQIVECIAEDWVTKYSNSAGVYQGGGVAFVRHIPFRTQGIFVSNNHFRAKPSSERTAGSGFEGKASFYLHANNMGAIDWAKGLSVVSDNSIILGTGYATDIDEGIFFNGFGELIVSNNTFDGHHGQTIVYGINALTLTPAGLGGDGNGVCSITVDGNIFGPWLFGGIYFTNGSNTSEYYRRCKSFTVTNNIQQSGDYFIRTAAYTALTYEGCREMVIANNVIQELNPAGNPPPSVNNYGIMIAASEASDVVLCHDNIIRGKTYDILTPTGYCSASSQVRRYLNTAVNISVPFYAPNVFDMDQIELGPQAIVTGSDATIQPNIVIKNTTTNAQSQWYQQSTSTYLINTNDLNVHTDGAVQTVTDSNVFRPGADNTKTLGNASFRWSTVYAGTGTINTSDERSKQDTGAIPKEWLEAWGSVQYTRFRFKDSVADKGDQSRWHVGLIAQRVKEAFESKGIDPFSIGILCYDKWDDQFVAVLDENGNPTDKKCLAVPAGDRYGIRYEEALALECAYLRSKLK